MPPSTYLTDIKEFILRSLEERLLQSNPERRTLMEVCGLDRRLRDRVTVDGLPPETFVNGLVDECEQYGKLETGEFALVTLLKGLKAKKYVGLDKHAPINELILKALAISTFHVCLICDLDWNDYSPFVKKYEGAIPEYQKFSDTIKRINELNRGRRGKYPNFDISHYFPLGCEILCSRYEDVEKHLETDTLVALLVDSSVFDRASDKEQCLDQLEKLLKKMVEEPHYSAIGIGYVNNFKVNLSSIPERLSKLLDSKIFEENLSNEKDIAYLLWGHYDSVFSLRESSKNLRDAQVVVNHDPRRTVRR